MRLTMKDVLFCSNTYVSLAGEILSLILFQRNATWSRSIFMRAVELQTITLRLQDLVARVSMGFLALNLDNTVVDNTYSVEENIFIRARYRASWNRVI